MKKPSPAVIETLKRWAPWVLAAAVLFLVGRQARDVEWDKVWASVQDLPWHVIALSALLALAAHTLFASYDLIGRHLTRHRLGPARSVGIAAISYAFNLNFGALIGGVGMRLRLYTRAGLSAGTVAQVVMHSVIANWLGWCWILGTVLLVSPPTLEAEWAPSAVALRSLGVVLLVVALAYHALCMFSRRQELRWRTHTLPLAGARMAWLQAAMGAGVWMLMSLSLWNLLQGRVPYTLVLGTLLLAGVAGALTHVPSGLGVLESVVAAALAGLMPLNELLAAVLAYRAVHYLLPLAIALPAYAFSEWWGPRSGVERGKTASKRSRSPARTDAPRPSA